MTRPSIAAQLRKVAGKRRDVRLLERWKPRKLIAWNRGPAREIDLQGEESCLVRWKSPK